MSECLLARLGNSQESKDENGSNVEVRSEISHKSRSSSSKGSKCSSLRSSISGRKRAELSAKLARLETERKYQDNVIKAKAELEKLELNKEIEATHAELDAVKQIEEEDEMQPRPPLNYPIGEDGQPSFGLPNEYLADSKNLGYGRKHALSLSCSQSLISYNKSLDNQRLFDEYVGRKEKGTADLGLNPNASEFRFEESDLLQSNKCSLDENKQESKNKTFGRAGLDRRSCPDDGISLPDRFKHNSGTGIHPKVPNEYFDNPRTNINSDHAFVDGATSRTKSHGLMADNVKPFEIPTGTSNQCTQSAQWDILKGFADLQNRNLERLADLFATKHQKDKLPAKEPEVFSGEFLMYPTWKASFITLIENKTDDAIERLYYLSKYTSGEAKNAISNLISVGTPDAAMHMLKLRKFLMTGLAIRL